MMGHESEPPSVPRGPIMMGGGLCNMLKGLRIKSPEAG